MFIKYSTRLIPLKKSRVKGSQGKKLDVTPKPRSVEVSDESDHDPEPARRQNCQRRMSKKKVSISVDDNIITESDVAYELGKSMSLTEAAEEEAARQVHATHERIVVESDPEPARRRPSGIAFRDTSSVSKKISPDPSQKLKGIQPLTAKEQLATDTMQALKSSRKSSRSQPHVRGISEGTGVSPGVPDESTIILTTLSEGTGIKPEVPMRKVMIKMTEALTLKRLMMMNKTNDEFVHGEEYVQEDMDEETKDAEVADTGKDDEEITNDEKTKVIKGDLEQAGKLLLTSSSLSVSSSFELKQVDHSAKILASIRSQVPPAVNEYLGSSLGDALRKKHALFQTMTDSESFNKYLAHKALYHALMESLLADEEGMYQGVADLLKKKRQHDAEDEDPSSRPNQGKKTKRRRTKESESSKKSSALKDTSKGNSPPKTLKFDKSMDAKETVVEPTKEVNLDAANKNVVNDADQPQDDSEPKIKDPLTFDELMDTPIDFSKFVMNHLKIDKLTKAHLVVPVYNLLKGTCQSSIELEYNMKECYKALSDKLDWNNPEGDHRPFDLSKPLPLKGRSDAEEADPQKLRKISGCKGTRYGLQADAKERNRDHINACTTYMLYYLVIKKTFDLTTLIVLRMDDVKRNNDGPMPYAMLLTKLYKYILQKNPQSVVLFDSFMFHQRVMNPLDIPKKTIKDKGKRAAPPTPPPLHHLMKKKNHHSWISMKNFQMMRT
uniref:Uncharacterized protein n=1 Tax=Tanacetum cinerariifolium TaxID=118510 RepID=A0A6L2NQP9_TANCI|nr:hypothetical protein [Tanacetum cinerariifolium]